jgi:hypothetical protein
MNTSEFSRFKKDLDPEFANQLYERITNDKSMIDHFKAIVREPSSLLQAGLLLVVAIVIVAACARQLFEPRNVQIGGLWVHEMSESAYCEPVDVVYPNYTPSSPLPTPQSQSPSTVAMISLQELRERLDFKFEIPVWAPEGFELVQEVYPPASFSHRPIFSIGWRHPGNRGIFLMLRRTSDWPSGREVPAAFGSWEEVTVQGDPAVLVRPVCADYPTWPRVLGGDRLSLHWSRNGVEYSLYSNDIDREAMLRMAESAR